MEEFFDYAVRGTKDKYRRKKYVAGGMYHVFNRRSDEAPVFLDDVDRLAFVEILQRFLEPAMFKDSRGRSAPPTHGEISLRGYALLTTHYHSVIRQELVDGMTRFMRRVQIAYTKHFNARHDRKGPLFDERYPGFRS